MSFIKNSAAITLHEVPYSRDATHRRNINCSPIHHVLQYVTSVLFLMGAVFALGCSTDSKHGTVAGTVTLDGQPLENGLIRFVPADGQSTSADAAVEHGTFTAQVPVGDKKVWISAPKVVGKRKMYDTPDSPTVDITQELLPARYNAQTTLTLTVAPGKQQPAFELKTGK